jgi:hypothetical protein
LRFLRQEDIRVSKRTFGLVAGVLGSAVGAWLWSRQRWNARSAGQTPSRDHGTVIYHNNPTAVEDVEL